MATGENKYQVLVASQGDRFRDFIVQTMPFSEYEILPTVASAGEVRRMLLSQSVDILLVNAPLKDEFGTELALDFADRAMGIAIFTEAQFYDKICRMVEDKGVFTEPKPLGRQAAYAVVRLLTALSQRLRRSENETKKLQEKLTDMRVIDHAKWLLIDKMGMNEQEAHHYLEKQAMDYRISKREAAEGIVRVYEYD